jgi:heat-inducible transcriptional repressor
VNLDELLEESTLHLARFSGCTVFGISRQAQDATYQFEILPAGRRILAVMVIAPGGSVKNYFYKAESDVTPKDAAVLTKIFNTVFADCPVNRIGKLRMMLFEHEIKANCPEHSGIGLLAQKILNDTQKCTLHIGGTENLLSHPEFSDIESARGFIEMLSTREQLLEALMEKNPVEGLEIRIGAENGLLNSPHASLITLSSDEKFPVMLGLIGPARMNYARTIAGCYFTLANLKNFIEREY